MTMVNWTLIAVVVLHSSIAGSMTTSEMNSINYDTLPSKFVLSNRSNLEEHCTIEGVFPYEYDCTMYYQCIYYWDEWYYFLFQCAEGGHFDAIDSACIFGPCKAASSTTEAETVADTTSTETEEPTSTQYYSTTIDSSSTYQSTTASYSTSSPKPCRKHLSL